MRPARVLLLMLCLFLPPGLARADLAGFADWDEVQAQARGQTVYWRAWAGDAQVNRFIVWAAQQLKARYGIDLRHVKEEDPSNVITSILADKAAGRDNGGRTDLLWINGANFAALKQRQLLYGPFAESLPNFRLVDTEAKPTTVRDFTIPTEGYESPWGMALLTFYWDSARAEQPPRRLAELPAWAKAHPGRFTYPAPPDFTGTTFLKQAMSLLIEDRALLQAPPVDADFAGVTAPLWAWLDALHPLLWRQGRAFPPNYPRLRQLVEDGEVTLAFSFNPAEATSAIAQGLLPASVRAFIPEEGSIGNTHFVAIPWNAANRAGALVVANFLLSPEAQLRKADPTLWGDPTVLALDRLAPNDWARFMVQQGAAMPSPQEMARVLPEPHPDWAARLEAEWRRRYAR